jgi:medium-chain acyl-[acyl-carrier-protein] hydrolase
VNTDAASRRYEWFPTAGRAAGGEVRLICLPALGAGVAPYAQWHRILPAWVESLPVRLPGTEARATERPIATLDSLVAELYEQQSHLTPRPTALLGHCFGAVLAFELARAMSVHGHAPTLLWVHAQVAPAAVARLPVSSADPWERFCAYAVVPQRLRANASMKRLLVPVLTAQFAILDDYCAPAADTELDVPLVASRGADDQVVGDADLAGWMKATRAGAELLTFPGGHNLDSKPAGFLNEVARRLEPYRTGQNG